MQFHSTKYQAPKVTFKQAIMHSEAPDQGLYMPDTIPALPKAFFNNLTDMSLNEIAYVVSNMLFGSDIPSSELKRITDLAVNFKMPLTQLDDNLYMLELYHGPTGTIKDIGSRFLGLMLNYFNGSNSSTINVLLATSGNTGNAVSLAMADIPGLNVITLYPSDRPDMQLIDNHSKNVHLLPVNGSLQDCRRLTNEAINDPVLCQKRILTSANSTNIGRTLFHTFIYFQGIAQLLKQNPKAKNIVFGVPSANCGTLLAGCIAKRMGLPIAKIQAACNISGSINDYLNGSTSLRENNNLESLAYALDVHFPSNLSRIIDFYGSKQAIADDIESCIITEEGIRRTISESKCEIDPHTAVAMSCLQQKLGKDQTGIILATAHPDVAKGMRQSELTPQSKCLNKKSNGIPVPPTLPALKKRLIPLLK